MLFLIILLTIFFTMIAIPLVALVVLHFTPTQKSGKYQTASSQGRKLSVIPEGEDEMSTSSHPQLSSDSTRAWASRRTKVIRKPGSHTRLLILLGSGGHTAEMLSILRDMDTAKYTHRSYVISSGDDFSAAKAWEFERGLKDKAGEMEEGAPRAYGKYDVSVVPRARRVHQGIWTTPWTSLLCLWQCFAVLRGRATSSTHVAPKSKSKVNQLVYPDVIVTNGPGTAVIVIFAALVLRFISCLLPSFISSFLRLKDTRGAGNGRMRTVYVESWARVKRLSLSGKILLKLKMIDRFLVQWEALLPATGGKGEHLGFLV